MTRLDKPITRETNKVVGSRPVILTVAPAGSQNETLIGLRLKGQRAQYVVALSDVYRCAALWHSQKESKAKREARRNGVSWKIARKQFIKDNSL